MDDGVRVEWTQTVGHANTVWKYTLSLAVLALVPVVCSAQTTVRGERSVHRFFFRTDLQLNNGAVCRQFLFRLAFNHDRFRDGG